MTSPSDTRPWVRIAVVAYRSDGVLQACVDALAAQTDGAFEAVIVDNESEGGSAARIALPDARFSVVASAENTGFSGGSNLGLEDAQTPWVMTVNPDTMLDPDALAALRRATRDYPGTAMFSPVLYADAARTRLDGLGDVMSVYGIAWRGGYHHAPNVLPENGVEVFSPTGAAALYRRDAFERAGGFDARFFCYLEDVALGLRLRGLGERCRLVTDATGLHAGGHSTQALPDFALFHTARNGPLLLVGSLPWPLLVGLFPLYIAAQTWLQWRARGTRVARVRREGYRAGRGLIGAALRDRPAYPWGASWRVLRRLTPSLRKLRRLSPVFWQD